MKFKIDEQVFEKFPGMVTAIPVIIGIDNTKSGKEALNFLREQEEELKKRLKLDQLAKEKQVAKFFEVFAQLGIDGQKFPPSHYSLAKRVLEGHQLPDINPMVNFYNGMSLKHLTPFGGEDLSDF